MYYRREIDGLRAIAVIAVVIFHLSRTALPGGFLGVDMFFCISGYLITSIIWRDITSNTFSTVRFYERRIRRIAPALLTVLIATTVAATTILLPVDLIGYGKSLIASIFFVANIYFWRDSDYFSRIAEEKPLLHLWSLGIEEQFYILFPLLLLALWRWLPRRAAMPVLVALMLGSLALNCLALTQNAQGPAFYLLPTRVWELAFGSLLALAPSIRISGSGASSLGLAAVTLVGLGFAWGRDLLGFLPAALPVVGGTGIILAAGPGNALLARVLKSPPFTGIGLISYSLYLWHWPLVVFLRYILVRDLMPGEMLLAFLAMLLLAYGSWRYIEQPFRHGVMPIGRVLLWTGGGTALVGVAGLALIIANGLPARLSVQAAAINASVGTNYRCGVSDYRSFGESRACDLYLPGGKLAETEVVYMGNSHAQMFAPILRDLLRQSGRAGILVPLSGCLPTVIYNTEVNCIQLAQGNLAALATLPKLRVVVLGMNYDHDTLVDPSGKAIAADTTLAEQQAIDDLIDRLRARRLKVVLVGPIAIPGYDIASEISRKLAFGRPINSPLDVPEAQFLAKYGQLISHFSARSDVIFIRPDRAQCQHDRCDFIRGQISLFADSNHIAAPALPLFKPGFAAALKPVI